MPHQRQALLKDIQDIRFTYSPTGKIKIESKKDMKVRLGFSPDVGDALCLTFTHKIRNKAMQETQRQQEVAIGSWGKTHQPRDDGHYREVRVR